MSFGRLERRSGPAPMSDINMTPLIDVMLVLLVIFMITAPLMSSALKLDLPRADAPGAAAQPALAVAVDAQGRMFLGDRPLADDELQRRAQAAVAADPNAELHLRADRAVPYGRVAELIARVQAAGLNRIAFVTEPPQER